MKFSLAVATGVVLLLPQPALACATCFGDPGSPQTQAANMAIFFMLGVIGAVLALISTFALVLGLRARHLAAAATEVPDAVPTLKHRDEMECAHE